MSGRGRKLVDAFDVFLLDLDGVVYVGARALSGAPAAIAELRRRGKVVRFLTNDPRPTRTELAARLTALGIPAGLEDLVTAGWATAAWLRRKGLRSAYALGGPGLASELAAAGIALVEQGPDAVVAGCDERVDYAGLHAAAAHILAGADFVATNPDPWQVFGYPSGDVVDFVTTCFACRVVGGRLEADGVETAEVACPMTSCPCTRRGSATRSPAASPRSSAELLQISESWRRMISACSPGGALCSSAISARSRGVRIMRYRASLEAA